MSPNRRGVEVGERGTVVGEKVANKVTKKRVAKKVAKKRVAEVADTWNRTSPSVTSVRNLGNSPRVPGGHVVAGGGRSLSGSRDERGTRPTQRCVMDLLSMAVVPEERRAFRQRFEGARKEENGACCNFFAKPRSACFRRRSNASRFNCVRLPKCSPSPDSSRSSSTSFT